MRQTFSVVAVLAILPVLVSTPAKILAQESSDTQQSFTVDENLAKQGSRLWLNKGCEGCHTIGKGPSSGPDLLNVQERREMDWLVRWLTDTEEMLDTDETAQQLLAEYNNTRMPDLKLRETEAKALIHYIAQRSAKKSSE
jgi:cbb3-type cytochrome oxidase cytochrome c subunit